jgi:hypothetical protein
MAEHNETPAEMRARILAAAMLRKPDKDGYRYYSSTSSGWTNSVNIDAPKNKRWRARHPDFGDKFFSHPDDILAFTSKLLATLAMAALRLNR